MMALSSSAPGHLPYWHPLNPLSHPLIHVGFVFMLPACLIMPEPYAWHRGVFRPEAPCSGALQQPKRSLAQPKSLLNLKPKILNNIFIYI